MISPSQYLPVVSFFVLKATLGALPHEWTVVKTFEEFAEFRKELMKDAEAKALLKKLDFPNKRRMSRPSAKELDGRQAALRYFLEGVFHSSLQHAGQPLGAHLTSNLHAFLQVAARSPKPHPPVPVPQTNTTNSSDQRPSLQRASTLPVPRSRRPSAPPRLEKSPSEGNPFASAGPPGNPQTGTPQQKPKKQTRKASANSPKALTQLL